MADVDLKPLPKPSDETLEEISDAIVSGYDVADLGRVLRFKWGFVLGDYIDTRQGFRYVVSDLVGWAQRKGKALELLALAYSQAPGNQDLQAVATKCGLTRQQVELKYRADGPATKPPSLEAMVNTHSRLIDFEHFLRRLRDVGDRVCRVETPFKTGTGFLVAPDRVLTNFHVVEEVVTRPETVICRFDHRETRDGEPPHASRPYRVGAGGVLASSPYGRSDLTGTGEPAPNELDYAVLQLADPVGPGREDRPRGWFGLVEEAPVVALRDFLVIPQHAGGEALRIAWGSVVAFPAAGNRVRYDTTTAAGSSGAPCFTADLEIVGLHHAAEASHNPTYNQAVPLRLIARDLAAKGIVSVAA